MDRRKEARGQPDGNSMGPQVKGAGNRSRAMTFGQSGPAGEGKWPARWAAAELLGCSLEAHRSCRVPWQLVPAWEIGMDVLAQKSANNLKVLCGTVFTPLK